MKTTPASRETSGLNRRHFLRGLGIALPDMPLGDPGIFAKEVCAAIPPQDRAIRYRAAFVPHHGSIAHPLYAKAGG